MKFIIILCFMIAVITIQTLNAAKICVIQTSTCNSNVTACGRYGSSNLCKKFRNNCALQSANCADNVGYTAVNATRCRSISLNQRATCYGLSSSNSNVQPIVINTGK